MPGSVYRNRESLHFLAVLSEGPCTANMCADNGIKFIEHLNKARNPLWLLPAEDMSNTPQPRFHQINFPVEVIHQNFSDGSSTTPTEHEGVQDLFGDISRHPQSRCKPVTPTIRSGDVTGEPAAINPLHFALRCIQVFVVSLCDDEKGSGKGTSEIKIEGTWI
jgi:hypothetical protein